MKILILSTDTAIFRSDSPVRERMKQYGVLGQELHVFVVGAKGTVDHISENVWAYPVPSQLKLLTPFALVKAVGKIIASKGKEDFVITAQDPFENGFAGWLIARKYSIPLQLQVHTDFLSPYFIKHSIVNRVRVFFASFLLPKAQGIRVVREGIKKAIMEKYSIAESRITTLPIFVDQNAIEQSPIHADLKKMYPQFDTIVLMASRSTKEKNIGLAITAFSQVVEKHRKVGLIIVGDGPMKNTLKDKVGNLGMKEHIIFENWNQDLVSYYKTADVFLLTSWFEGYGLTLIEAALARCPIVTTNVGIATDLFVDGENACVCRVGDSQSVAYALDKIIGDHELRKKQSDALYQTVSRSIQTEWNHYVELFKASLQNLYR